MNNVVNNKATKTQYKMKKVGSLISYIACLYYNQTFSLQTGDWTRGLMLFKEVDFFHIKKFKQVDYSSFMAKWEIAPDLSIYS